MNILRASAAAASAAEWAADGGLLQSCSGCRRYLSAVNKFLPNSRRHQYIHHHLHTMRPQRDAADLYCYTFQ
jgi:hypothetical protein